MTELHFKIAALYEEQDPVPDLRWLYPGEPSEFQLHMADCINEFSKNLKYTKYDDSNSRPSPVQD